MPRLIITKPAERQLENIAEWTLKNWGETQVEMYKHDLNMGLMNILEHPRIGQDVSDLKAGLRKLPVEEHFIYYELKDDAVIIHAFLHGRQNPENHL
ncbi:type II toxin-antitoxin system RelE/ParE family toxin [Hirschia litorea]|uniref:Type II toxin-antitoxin system RelE/ParE family toxin n=1 Tax=Hirschia litorea TaxID=1199156 RepID=A0ABW2IPI6_9PROT